MRRRWEADFTGLGSRRSRKGFSYEAFVPDEIAQLSVPLRSDLAHAIAEAEEQIRELNRWPPTVGSLETLARQLLRAESVASSRIEGLQPSHRRLAKASFDRDSDDLTALSVLANMNAMEEAVKVATARKAIRVSDLAHLHHTLFSAFLDPTAGKLRTEQSWIGGAASNPRNAEFVPPPPEEVRPLLEDLCRFLAREDLSPLLQAAIAHAQFETIHPFADGNGRVGRCLIHIVLRRRGLAPSYVPPVSLVLATASKQYLAGLTSFRAGAIDDWCEVFADAARLAARDARIFAQHVEKLQARWRTQAHEPRAKSAASKLISALPAFPIVDVSTVETIARCSNQAARLAVAHLEAAKVVTRINVGRRHRAWEAREVFELEQHLATRRGGRTRMRPAPA